MTSDLTALLQRVKEKVYPTNYQTNNTNLFFLHKSYFDISPVCPVFHYIDKVWYIWYILFIQYIYFICDNYKAF